MHKPGDPLALERLVQEVLASNKYRGICPEFIASIGTQELSKRRNFKEALKATKNKLHQVSGVYVEKREDQQQHLIALQNALQSDNQGLLKQVCREIMSQHISTRERLPLLDQFYSTLFATLPPITSVIDIACGLHPLAIPWMNLAPETRYYAYDVQQDLIAFLTGALTFLPIQGQAYARDVLQSCPTRQVDVAFLLKTLPCLEQIEKRAGQRLLHTLNARHLIVSFPIASLGGHSKGMATFYEAHFYDLLADFPWPIERFEFATELVFVVKKDAGTP